MFYGINYVCYGGHDSIVMIDSITRSFCLRHYVQNGLSYLGEETRPKMCINDAKRRPGVPDLEQNKHQLLHRIASVKTPLTSIVFKDIRHK